jgi:hypothetical protein
MISKITRGVKHVCVSFWLRGHASLGIDGLAVFAVLEDRKCFGAFSKSLKDNSMFASAQRSISIIVLAVLLFPSYLKPSTPPP